MNCPNCNQILLQRKINDIEIDYCENGCKGIWFDRGEITKIKNINYQQKHKDLAVMYTPKTKEEIESEEMRPCPKCNIIMDKINKPKNTDIFLDRCQKCKGIWLDQGELSAIHNYFKQNKRSRKDFDDFLFDVVVLEILFAVIEGVVDTAVDSF